MNTLMNDYVIATRTYRTPSPRQWRHVSAGRQTRRPQRVFSRVWR